MDRRLRDRLLYVEGELQDGRLHDVSVDGGPEMPAFQPGSELGSAPLHASTAWNRGLLASSVGRADTGAPAVRPPPDIAAEGLASDDSDRIERGVRGGHLAGRRAHFQAEVKP